MAMNIETGTESQIGSSASDMFDIAAFVQSLDPTAERALAVADSFRRDRRQDTLHMEHLLIGLYAEDNGPTRRAFERAGIGPQRFVQTLREHKLAAPEARRARDGGADRYELRLPEKAVFRNDLPSLSKHVRFALASAATLPPQFGNKISTYHLLAAAFAVADCTAIGAFEIARQHVSVVLQEKLNQTAPEAPTPEQGFSEQAPVPEPSNPAPPPNVPVWHMSEAGAAGPAIQREAELRSGDAGPFRPSKVPSPTNAQTRGSGEPAGSSARISRESQGADEAGPAAQEPRVAQPFIGTGAANDQARGEDQLGFIHYVEAFAELIESPDTRPPLVIGIFGSWGAGKSFLLTSLTNALSARGTLHLSPARRVGRWFADRYVHKAPTRRRARVYCVNFNAWEYNASETIWPRLVRRILDAVGGEVHWYSRPILWLLRGLRKLRKNFLRKLREDWAALAAWLVIGAVIGWAVAFVLPAGFNRWLSRLLGIDVENPQFSVALAVGSLAATAKLLKETFFAPLGGWVTALVDSGRSYGGEVDVMRAIRDDLDLLDRQLRQENSRVLIVVDDLDRCEPEKAIEVLQAINLLLDRGSFIVALGIDARVITAAVEKHYKELLGPAGITGYEYLDKIVQIPFKIPEPTPTDLRGFLEKQLGRPDTSRGSQPENEPKQALAPVTWQETLESVRKLAKRIAGTNAPTSQATSLAGPAQAQSIAVSEKSAELSAEDRDQLQAAIRVGKAATAVLTPIIGSPGTELFKQALDATDELATYQPQQPPPPLAFRDEELKAFKDIADYLRPNPRHIKRVVNVYALVRALAQRKGERRILDDPAATVLWLALCAQWPYATREMLRQHDALEDERARNNTPYPAEAPLRYLLARAASTLEDVKRRRFDHDAVILDRLVNSGDELSWDDLRVMRRYTLNFNPALDSELRAGEQERRKRKRSDPSPQATGPTGASQSQVGGV